MTDTEKLYARLDALQMLNNNLSAAQSGSVMAIRAAEYYRLCAAITARQTETLLKLASIMDEKLGIVEMKGETS